LKTHKSTRMTRDRCQWQTPTVTRTFQCVRLTFLGWTNHYKSLEVENIVFPCFIFTPSRHKTFYPNACGIYLRNIASVWVGWASQWFPCPCFRVCSRRKGEDSCESHFQLLISRKTTCGWSI